MKEKTHSPVPKKIRSISIGMSFPDAIKEVMKGKKIRRLEWLDMGEHGVLNLNFLMIYRNGKYHNWIVSEGDMEATDWVADK